MTKILLQVTDLAVAYGQVSALHDFSCSVEEGRITALVGSNGAGKSTFLRCLAGLLGPSSGSAIFDDLDVTRMPSDQRVENGMSMVPEGRMIFPNFTVEQNLKIGAISKRARNDRDDNVALAYELFPRLKERRRQLGGTLSGGEQQMLAIARGLMSRPRLLMLDEPTLGLAPLMAQAIFEMITQLRDSGLTILIVEQDVSRTLQIADKAYVLENGYGVMEGLAADVLANPKVRESYLGI